MLTETLKAIQCLAIEAINDEDIPEARPVN
jgi:hypothetical protein